MRFSRAICPGPWTRPRPATSTCPVTTRRPCHAGAAIHQDDPGSDDQGRRGKAALLSIMNMPPFLAQAIWRSPEMELEEAYTDAQVWERFKPGLVSLCSPDPQAFRPPEEAAMSFTWACRQTSRPRYSKIEKHDRLLRELESDIEAVKLEAGRSGKTQGVRFAVVPLAKWSMLLTRNYRCITPHERR